MSACLDCGGHGGCFPHCTRSPDEWCSGCGQKHSKCECGPDCRCATLRPGDDCPAHPFDPTQYKPVTAASGADTFGPAGGFRNAGRLSNSANAPASGTDQPTLRGPFRGSPPFEHSVRCTAPDPETCRKRGCEVQLTLRDQLAEVLHKRWGGDIRLYDAVDALLPVIEADRERAKAEGGAEALEQVAKIALPASGVRGLILDRAAALRGSTGGGT